MQNEIYISAVLVILSTAVVYLVFRGRYKTQKAIIDNLTNSKEVLSAKIQTLESELKTKNPSSSKTSFVMDQIKKIESLEHELHRQQHRLADVKNMAEKANRIKSDFLSHLSETITDPLRIIIKAAQELQAGVQTKKDINNADAILEYANRLLKELDNIIKLSQVEKGTLVLHENAIESRVFFENIVERYRSQAIRKGLELELLIDEKVPESLMLDSARVQDVFVNLLKNALEFTYKGYVKVEVRLESVDSLRNEVNLSILVEDSGVGIEEKKQADIFEFTGNNVELSVDKKIAQLMDGDITFVSQEGKGSTFTLLLKNVEILLLSAEDVVEERDVDFSLLREDAKVVVIDDMDQTRNRIATYFQESSVHLYLYKTLKESMQTLQNEKVDLILIDVEILNLDDGAVSKVIARLSDAYVVPLTALRLKEIELSEEGVKPLAYLKKPIAKVELFKVALKLLNSTLAVIDK